MQKEQWKSVGCGAAAGLVNGLFGAGGGMVLVPLLRKWTRTQPRAVFPTALAVMLPISAVSFAVYLLRGAVEIGVALPYCIGGVLGGLLGGVFYKKVPTKWLHRALGILILWGGLRLLL